MSRTASLTRFVLVIVLAAAPAALMAQDFKLFDRNFQVHGFAGQGIIWTDQNNWLTMPTSQGSGSAKWTEMGINISVPVTDKLRVGAQFYDRELGQLGKWDPDLDWANASYRLRPWLGFRAGKVKTTLGLFTDTQDLDFLRVFALLPQSVYPIDLRDSNIAHLGGDVFGDIRLQHKMGVISYTVYSGHRSDSLDSGYPYDIKSLGVNLTSYGGLQYGGDLRWATPLKGLLVGTSRLSEDITGKGNLPVSGLAPTGKWEEHSNADWSEQFYGQYTRGNLEVDTEWRRYWRNEQIFSGLFAFQTDARGAYMSAAYRVTKWFAAGTYYSHYHITDEAGAFGGATHGSTNDRVVSARFDVNRYTNIKVEAHFMAGVGLPGDYPDGFYTTVNPQGLKPDTAAFVLKGGFNF